jgi:hypothetical protein
MQKVEYGMQVNIATVFEVMDDHSFYTVKFDNEDIPKVAVLLMHPKFYILNGFPKSGEKVIVIHNNGNAVHILFTSNPKLEDMPPYLSDYSAKKASISSAKCS